VDKEHLEGGDEHLEGDSKSMEGWVMMHNLYLVIYLY
jgi:hypothetical protein